jgi:uncharacterized protein
VRLQFSGEFRFEGSREQVWDLLTDPAVLARCLPGCRRLEPAGADTYAATLQMGLAAIKGTYEGSLALLERDEPSHLTLRLEAAGSTGFARVSGGLDFREDRGGTLVAHQWEVQAGGPVAMVGQRVLGGVAKWIIDEFFSAAARELAATLRTGG